MRADWFARAFFDSHGGEVAMRRIALAFSGRRITHRGFALALVLLLARLSVAADDVQWIWSPAFEKELAPQGVCYFRKTLNLTNPEQGEIQISADDKYDLFVNGRKVGGGENWKKLDVYDITKFLTTGQNVIAVKAENLEGGSAALAARLIVKQQGGTHESHSSGNSWKTTLKEFPRWQMPRLTTLNGLPRARSDNSAPRCRGEMKWCCPRIPAGSRCCRTFRWNG
jgi:hypothetical protein